MLLFINLIALLSIIFIYYRISNKKNIMHLSIIDLILIILLVNMIINNISTNTFSFSLLYTIFFMLVYQFIISYLSIKGISFKYFVKNKESLIIDNGKLNFKEMINQNYNIDDLVLTLHKNKIKSIEEVEYAELSKAGKLLFHLYPKDRLTKKCPLPLIVDGLIQYKTLKFLNKKENWISELLKNNNVDINEIFYAFIKEKKTFIIRK
jgi:uncharacterized membrane protein YcaP (DUF421 family)